jgi:hypothetical protein
MNCCESLQENRLVLHSKRKDKANRYCHSGIFSGRSESPFSSLSTSDSDLNLSFLRNLIERYTARDLSYDHDSLNAFTGILKYFCEPKQSRTGMLWEDSFHHIWGLPFICRRWQQPLPSDSNSIYRTLINSSWRHRLNGDSTPTRRKAFPSWSWAGWSGAIDFSPALWGVRNKNIWLELEDGSRVRFDSTALPPHSTDFPQPRALHLDARFVDVTRLRIDSSTKCRPFSLGRRRGTFFWSVPQKNEMDFLARFEKHEYKIMALKNRPCGSQDGVAFDYLVIESHPCFYSRVGEAEIDGRPKSISKRRLVRLE